MSYFAGIGQLLDSDAQRRAGEYRVGGAKAAAGAATPLIEQGWQGQQDILSPFSEASQSAMDNYAASVNDPYFGQDPEKFTFDKTVQDYVDPSMKFRIDRGRDALDASAAAQGGLFSSGHGMDLTTFGQNEGSQEYGKAFERYNTDRGQAYKQYSDFLTNQNQRRQQRATNAAGLASTALTGATNLSTQRGNYDASKIANAMDVARAPYDANAQRNMNQNLGMRSFFNGMGSTEDAAMQMGGQMAMTTATGGLSSVPKPSTPPPTNA